MPSVLSAIAVRAALIAAISATRVIDSHLPFDWNGTAWLEDAAEVGSRGRSRKKRRSPRGKTALSLPASGGAIHLSRLGTCSIHEVEVVISPTQAAISSGRRTVVAAPIASAR